MTDGELTLLDDRRPSVRAGHAHAGVPLARCPVSYQCLAWTTVADGPRRMGCSVLMVGVPALSGGSLVDLVAGQPSAPSAGIGGRAVGAGLLATALPLSVVPSRRPPCRAWPTAGRWGTNDGILSTWSPTST